MSNYLLVVAAYSASPTIAPVQTVVQSLAREANVKVTIETPLRRNALLFKRGSATPIEALGAVSEALSASLVRDAEGYRLKRSTADSNRLSKAIQEQRKTWIRKLLQRNAAAREAGRVGGSRAERILTRIRAMRRHHDQGQLAPADLVGNDLVPLLPQGELLDLVLASIGADRLAQVSAGKTEIFENRKGVGTNPLPAAKALLEAYGEQIQRIPWGQIAEVWKEEIGGRASFEPTWLLLPEDDVPVLLRVSVSSQLESVSFQLEGFQGDGKRVLVAGAVANPAAGMRQPSAELEELAPKSGSDDFIVTPEISAPLHFFYGGGRTSAPSGELPAWFREPDRLEPIAFMVGPTLAKLDIRAPGCLVAVVTDVMASDLAFALTAKRLGRKSLENYLFKNERYERLKQGKSVIFRLRDPIYFESHWLDRSILKGYVAGLSKSRTFDIENRCRFLADVSEAPAHHALNWCSASERAFLSSAPFSDQIPLDFYRLLGKIPHQGWLRLRQGGKVRASEFGLSDRFIEMLRNPNHPEVLGREKVSDAEQYPLGLVAQGGFHELALSAQLRTEPLEFSWTGDSISPFGAPPGNSVGVVMHIRKDGQFVPVESQVEYERQFAERRYQDGRRQDFEVRVELPRGRWMAASLQGGHERVGPVRRYQDLPDEVRAERYRIATEQGLELSRRMLGGGGYTSSGSR